MQATDIPGLLFVDLASFIHLSLGAEIFRSNAPLVRLKASPWVVHGTAGLQVSLRGAASTQVDRCWSKGRVGG